VDHVAAASVVVELTQQGASSRTETLRTGTTRVTISSPTPGLVSSTTGMAEVLASLGAYLSTPLFMGTTAKP
jgi:hypothetical protein